MNVAFIQLVHTTPGHGQEDFLIGMKYKLSVLSPVDDNGKFTEETRQFSSLDVLDDGNASNRFDETIYMFNLLFF